jgi:predicted acylesterase/phospholipase RssA
MQLLRLFTLVFLLTLTANTEELETNKAPINLSMVISGGVSLGAYEAGYNWAMIKMLNNIKHESKIVSPKLRSVTGASAGSINALLTSMYWCQKPEVTEKNSVEDNLFYSTWVELGLNDLIIKGRDVRNKSTLFSRKSLKKSADAMLEHLEKPIYELGCEVPLGFSVTKATPITTEFQNSGIKIQNQHFSIPFTIKEVNGKMKLFNRKMPKSTDYYISIPHIEEDNRLIIDVLFASSAFPGAFQQIKLDYLYEGEKKSNYFIDGGAYDNLPLQLATELDTRAKDFIFIDPSNMRNEVAEAEEQEKEEAPIGFLNSNALPLLNAVDIFQSMRLYSAITQYFGEGSGKKLILSSRQHPITGKFLGHFGAFLNRDFRVYDYHVGVYDAIYHLARSMKERGYFKDVSQKALMRHLKQKLGISKNKEANNAYKLFENAEFNGETHPPVKDNFSAIYNAFNKEKSDKKRYDITDFTVFLEKLDMRYIKDKDSFIPHDKKLLDEWYKTPLNLIIDRISALENDYAEVKGNSTALAKVTNMMTWVGRNLIKEKEGFHRAVNIPDDPDNKMLVKALKALPNEITTDLKNGGIGAAYNAYWYQKESYIDAYETKLSYNQSDDIDSFIRLDLNAFHEFDDFYKIGVGVSGFGNVEGKFYKKEGLYGFNTYVDILDIFRVTYVRRINHPREQDYVYLGLRNLTSLIYWLQR